MRYPADSPFAPAFRSSEGGAGRLRDGASDRSPHPGVRTGVPAAAALVALSLGLLLTPAALPGQGQDGRVVGTVQSEAGGPINGATVILQGTEFGAFTDGNGQYTLTAPPGDYTIAVHAVGYSDAEKPVTVTAGQTVTVDFALEAAAVDMEEVVVSLSASETRRMEFGTDIERLNAAEQIDDAAITSFSDLLSSRATGVSIEATSGGVGTASKIRVRGATSLTQDNNPLVYVDGVRVSNETGAGPRAIDQGDGQTISRLDDLNPEDIESVQVLKGPTAAAAYGSEAASGVVLIRTKHGSEGDTRFRTSAEVSSTHNTSDFSPNYFNLTRFTGITDPGDPDIQQFDPIQNPATGDVFARHHPIEQNDLFRTGLNFEGNVSLRGGTDLLNYYGSGNYSEAEGPIPSNNSQNISVRGNFSAHPSPDVDLSINSNYVEKNVRTSGSGRSATNPVANAILGLPQFGYGTREDGSRGDCLATFVFGSPESSCAGRQGNLLATFPKILDVVNKSEARRFMGSIELNVRPTGWWSNRFSMGIDLIDSHDYNLVPLDPDRPFDDRSRGEIDDFRNSERIVTVDYAGTANAGLTDDLSSSTTVGAQYFGRHREMLACQGRGGFAGPTATACSASLTFNTSTEVAEINEVGAYLQQQLRYRDYLFGTAAVRVDDNSGFGENQGAIVSPSVNASAVLSEMPFWDVDFVSNFRLRFSWGKAAQAPGPFDALRTFVPVRIEKGGEQVSGLKPEDPGNPNLKPERNEEFEAGFDASLWEDRVSVRFSYFNQTVTDAILDRRVSPGTGFSGPQFVNIAATENEGVEGVVSGRVIDGDDVDWDVSFQFQTEDPVITDMGDLAPIRGFFQMAGMFHEGYAPGSYYGPIYVDAQRDENHDIVPGSVELAPGNLDFRSNPNFRYQGRPNPTNRQTVSTTLRLFDRLNVSALFNRRAGHRRMNDTGGSRNCFIPDVSGGKLCAFREAMLTPAEQAALEEDVADAPQIFVTDGDFIKWRELTIRYRLPESVLSSVVGGLQSATVTVGGRNLATWTDYFGVDPEANISGGTDAFSNTGMYGTIGPARTFFGKISVVF